MIDMLTFSEADKSKQEWKTIAKEDKPREYIFIVDLGGHFLFAKKSTEALQSQISQTSIITTAQNYISQGKKRKKPEFHREQQNSSKKTKLEEEVECTSITSSSQNLTQDLEKQAMSAIEKGQSEDLRILVSQMEGGIKTRLEYGCRLLLYAIDQNSVVCAEALLKMGARLEDHEREYTSLFTAVENGRLSMVKLLLKYGANITGEFHFNKETALSISAYKFCMEFQQFLSNKLEQFSLSDKELAHEMKQWWVKASNQRIPLHIGFSQENCIDYATDCLKFFSRNDALWDHSDEIARRALIFDIIRYKCLVIKETAPSTEEDNYATEEDETLELTHIIEPVVTSTNQFQNLSREQLEEHIKRLNLELNQGKSESDIDWSKYPRFFIAQYRGIHYYRHYFTKKQRADNRTTLHLNRIAPAPAAYFMSSLSPVQHQLARESTIELKRKIITDTFEELKNSGPTKQYWPKKDVNFNNSMDMMQQRLSNTYKSSMEDIANPQNPTTQLIFDRGIRKGYPHYATSDLPTHAFKYAFGQKTLEGFTENRLRPVFQENGKPLHPYPGKLFMTMFTPLQMHQHRTLHVIGKHNKKQITLRGIR